MTKDKSLFDEGQRTLIDEKQRQPAKTLLEEYEDKKKDPSIREIKCPNCGKAMFVPKGISNPILCCSKECSKEYHKIMN